MATSDVKKVYQDIINEVCTAVREALSEEGYDDHTLQELKSLWLARLENSKALEPLPAMSITDQATTREFRHSTTGDATSSSSLNNKLAMGMKRIHPASNAAITNSNISYATTTLNPGIISVPTATTTTQFNRQTFLPRPANPTNLGNSTMKAMPQRDGANDEVISKKHAKKKSKMIKVSLQLDGTGPPMGDDDDDDDDDSEPEGNDVGDELDDDDDDDGNEEGREDPNPLNSEDDVSEDEEPTELFDTENVIVCQYDKITRTKNKWRFTLKSGVMNIEGRDYVFSKATGDADW